MPDFDTGWEPKSTGHEAPWKSQINLDLSYTEAQKLIAASAKTFNQKRLLIYWFKYFGE